MNREELAEAVKEIKEKLRLGRTLTVPEQHIRAYLMNAPACHHPHGPEYPMRNLKPEEE